jgi:hypothetical protein
MRNVANMTIAAPQHALVFVRHNSRYYLMTRKTFELRA